MRRVPLLILALLVLAAAPSSAAPESVSIGDACGPGPYYFCYSPQALTVSSGASVTWTNNSVTPLGHTVTRCTPSACGGVSGGSGSDNWSDSGTIHQGQTYSHSFTGAGTYVYYCTIHGYAQMHGTITVAGPVPPSAPAIANLRLKRAGHRETISFTLSAPGSVKLVVKRAGKALRTRTIAGRGGRNSVALSVAGLKHGRYVITATVAGGSSLRASFTV